MKLLIHLTKQIVSHIEDIDNIQNVSDISKYETFSHPSLEQLNHTTNKQNKYYINLKTKVARNPPKIHKDTWAKYDSEFSEINSNSWAKVRSREVEAETFVEELNKELANFLITKQEFQFEIKEYFKHKPPKTDPIKEMKTKKKELTKNLQTYKES